MMTYDDNKYCRNDGDGHVDHDDDGGIDADDFFLGLRVLKRSLFGPFWSKHRGKHGKTDTGKFENRIVL